MKKQVWWLCAAGAAALVLGQVWARVAPAPEEPRATSVAERKVDPTIQRDEVLRELERSGPERSPELGAKARGVLRAAAKQMGGDGAVRVETAACYRRGCAARVVFRNPPSFAMHQFPVGRACKDAWPGELFLSGPEPQPSGEVHSTLVLFHEA